MAALENRIPMAIWLMILSVSVLTLFSTGIAMPREFWYPVLAMPLMVAIVVGLIADLDSPRGGLIRSQQQTMLRLQADIAAESQNK